MTMPIDDPLGILEEQDGKRERLDGLASAVEERAPVTDATVGGREVGDRFELRLTVCYRPQDRGDGTPVYDVPEALLSWGDARGLVLRDVHTMRDQDLVAASFALAEDTPHSPRDVVADEFGALFDAGLSWREAGDFWLVERAGLRQTDAAGLRGVSQQAISDSIAAAREQLDASE